jgi:hypothetical protein
VTFEWVERTAAFLGAGLSLWLAVQRYLLDTRPLVSLESVKAHGGQTFLRLRCENTTKHPVHVRGVTCWWPRKHVILPIKGSNEESDELYRGALNWHLDVGRQQEACLEVCNAEGNNFDFDGAIMLAVHWRKHAPLMVPKMPVIVVRSRNEVAVMRRQPRQGDPEAEVC